MPLNLHRKEGLPLLCIMEFYNTVKFPDNYRTLNRASPVHHNVMSQVHNISCRYVKDKAKCQFVKIELKCDISGMLNSWLASGI